jgi:hypothetical protein
MMKNLILVLFVGFCTKAYSQTRSWSDLEEGKTYVVANDIVLNKEITLKKGDSLKYESTDGMEEVITLTFKDLSCQDGSLSTNDIAMINPDPAHPDLHHQIGIGFELGCYTSVYMEPMAFYDLSFLGEAGK